jgi:competence protein ComEC
MPQRLDDGWRFVLDVEQARHSDGTPVAASDLPQRLELSWYQPASVGLRAASGAEAADTVSDAAPWPPATEPAAGERWQLPVRLRAVHGAANPFGFDYELWQWERGVRASGYVRQSPREPVAQRLDASLAHPLERLRGWLRQRLWQGLTPDRSAGWVSALAVGDQAAIERADWDVFRATGVAHLMSISGLHITGLAWLVSVLLALAWRRLPAWALRVPAPLAGQVSGLLLASLYALLSGWGVPAQRTLVMLAVAVLLRGRGARWPWPLVIGLAATLVLAWDPWAAWQAGFWLSFVAVGVLFASDSGSISAQDTKAISRFVQAFKVQARLSLALAPLSLMLFGQVSLVGLLANLLAIPWVTLLIAPLAMGALVWPPLGQVAQWAVQALAWVLAHMAAWPWASVWLPQAPLAVGLAALAGVAVLLLRGPWVLRAGGLALVLPLVCWRPEGPPAGEVELLALDVGQGSALLLRTAGHALLFDAGPRYSQDADAGHRVVVPLLRALGVQLDTLMLSHADTDHVGGAAAVLAQQPQAQVLGSLPLPHPLRELRPLQPCVAGQGWVWDGVSFDVLHPTAAPEVSAGSNASSCVLRVQARGGAVLLTGDLPRTQEAQVVQRQQALGQSLRADVLVVPHHGSTTSSSAGFIAAVAPRFGVIQAGYRNRWGHPVGAVLVRYAQAGVAVVDTPHCGAANWQSWRPELVQCQRQTRRRIWQHQAP